MAVFGIQLAISMVMASIISKAGARMSLARYLLCNTGLMRYLHPGDAELKELAGVPKDMGSGKGKGKRSRGDDQKTSNSFHVPKNLDITLDTVKVSAIEVMHLRFYQEYHWVVDYTLYATIIYGVTEIYYALFGVPDETNLAVYWCLLTLGLCVSVLGSVTAVYFRGDQTMGERSLCMVMGLAYLLVAMIVLIIDESNLEVGVDPAYQSFHDHASAFLKAQGLPSTGPASKLILKFVLAVIAGFIGALFTFPGIRMSRMFYDSLKYCEGRPIVKFLLNLAFICPLFAITLWIPPLGRDLFTQSFGKYEALMSEEAFESFRLYLVVFMVVIRIAMMPYFLQAYLNVAQDRLNELKKEAGRILNTDLQTRVAGLYYYLCIVAVQYVTPILIILHCTFLYKTLGGGSWNASMKASDADSEGMTPAIFASLLPKEDEVKPEHFTVALSSLKVVFNATVFRGVFGFALWWCNFLLLASSGVGAGYLSFQGHS